MSWVGAATTLAGCEGSPWCRRVIRQLQTGAYVATPATLKADPKATLASTRLARMRNHRSAKPLRAESLTCVKQNKPRGARKTLL